jgi:restriction system protein
MTFVSSRDDLRGDSVETPNAGAPSAGAPSSAESPPKTRSRAAVLMKGALEALDAAGGTLQLRELFAAVAVRVELTRFDREVYEKSRRMRWIALIHFFAIHFVKAAFLRRHRGRWELTEEGRAVLHLPAEEILARATAGYEAWKAAQPIIVADAIGDAVSVGAAGVAPPPLVLETAEGDARSGIERFVRAMSPYEFQDLIAALLRAMGYTIAFVSGQGTDGGTDILAYPDPMGAKTPHIRVQVKHRQEKATREEVAALRGIIRHGREIGLFVSSGGFTSEAVREARHGAVHIELMDWEAVLDKWLSHYEDMREGARRLLRLRPVYFLASE